ncbi:ribokinase [Luteimonas sp. C3_2_a3]|uniref:ribokinase n=1 Tax=Luteimonas salinilitoris TaxID=3237697 RepID=UPI00351C4FD9
MSPDAVVLVAGSANLDFAVRAPHVPAAGETVLGHGFATFPGGKGANQAVACARAGGARTRMLLALGEDAFAAPVEASLREAGVTCEIVRVRDAATGTAFVCVSDDGENAITVTPGANARLHPAHLPALDGVRCLLLQLETPLPTVVAWARAARVAGVTVILNAAPAQALPAELLTAVDVLVVNEGELATVAGHRGGIAADLAAIDVAEVIVTLGARGCCARLDGGLHVQPGFRVDAVDTTAAGDTFCGTLAAAIARGLPVAEALRRACAASALACTRHGAQASVPAADEVDALLAGFADPAGDAYDDLAAYCAAAR